jgi:Txe/YoeB family toxin of Txe-Axe toxin-antitoxin module
MEQIEKKLELNFEEHRTIMEKIDDLTKSLVEIQISIAKLPEKMFEKADERYASKLSEKIVYGMAGTVLTLVLTALVFLVIKK